MAARPDRVEEVAEAVRAHDHVAAVGGRTKASLIGEGEEIEMTALSGVVEYEASEYTFSAKAGTPVGEISEALKEKGQYLPFDPVFVEAGATLGGTVAAGASGPGRFRYGGLRDFLIGVQFVDGVGKLVRSGGKVVKNAAGFDLPKFLVGSMGRFGILTEISFKVFPSPVETVTLAVQCADHQVAVDRMAEVASSRWEADALDYEVEGRRLLVRLGGPAPALNALSREISNRWDGAVTRLEREAAGEVWAGFLETLGAEDGVAVVRIPLSLSQFASVRESLDQVGVRGGRLSSGGAVWWLPVDDDHLGPVDARLRESGLAGLVIARRPVPSAWIGRRNKSEILGAVKHALDPDGRFPRI